VNMKTLEITDANFGEIVLQSTKTVLVDFTAEWCGPCKIMKPVISLLAGELSEVAVIPFGGVSGNLQEVSLRSTRRRDFLKFACRGGGK
jgi:thiol-disulfide isomerase/thioredoxin